AVEVDGVKGLAATLEGADVATLRETMDKLKDRLKTAAIVLAAVDGGKVSLIAGVTADATAKVKAGELVNFVARQVGGKGGGRPDMAQAGGTEPAQLPAARAAAADWARAPACTRNRAARAMRGLPHRSAARRRCARWSRSRSAITPRCRAAGSRCRWRRSNWARRRS